MPATSSRTLPLRPFRPVRLRRDATATLAFLVTRRCDAFTATRMRVRFAGGGSSVVTLDAPCETAG